MKDLEQATLEAKRQCLQSGGGPEYVREDANGYYNHHTGERLTEEQVLAEIAVDDVLVHQLMAE